MSFLLDITPADLGFRAPFNEYKPIQNENIDFIVNEFETKDTVAVCDPTGSGKTLIAVSVAKVMNARSVFVTAFKGLQEQYVSTFQQYGMVDIRGRTNYQCAGLPGLDCRSGQSAHCQYVKGRGCCYEVAKGLAKEAGLITTNYPYWFNVNDKAQGLERTEKEAEEWGRNPIELLVLDEADTAAESLSSYVSCRLYEHDLKRFSYYPMNESTGEWSAWAKLSLPTLLEEIKTTEMEVLLSSKDKKKLGKLVEILHRLEGLATTLNKIAFVKGDDWIIDMEVGTKYGRLWKFDCIWPGRYAKQYLFCGVKKVLLMSATLKERNLWDLGIKKIDYSFKSWRRIFPANRHPIYTVHARKPNGKLVRVDRKTSQADLEFLVKWMDREIIKPRLDRKGLIGTVAYSWQQVVFEHSEYTNIMIGNTQEPDSDSAQEAAEEFRNSKPPSLLVSPSFVAGWDFPLDQCEYAILFKTPLLPTFSKITKARMKRDPRYVDALGIRHLEQFIGRPMRQIFDRAEIFLIDAHILWWFQQNKDLAQDWLAAPGTIRGVPTVPKPPMRLVDELKLGKAK